MYPPLSFTPLKAMLLASLDNITFAEIGVFMLFFLVFVFCFFLSLIFWGFRRILFLFFLIETGILLSIPYGISAVSQKIIYPIEVRYDKFRPFVYTTGFNYDIEITSKAKLPLKKCFLSIIPKREGANILPKPKNLALLDSTQTESNQIDSAQVDSLQADFQTDSSQMDYNDKKPSQDNEQSNQTNEQSSQAQNLEQDLDNTPKESSNSNEAKSSQESLEKSTTEPQTQSNAEQKQDAKSSPTKPTEQNTQKPPKQPKPPSQYALKAYKILDYIIPLDAFVEVLELESPLKYNKKVRWQGIIRDYKYDENFSAQVSCH